MSILGLPELTQLYEERIYEYCLANSKPYFSQYMEALLPHPLRAPYMFLLAKAEVAQLARPVKFLDIGTWAGGSALLWAEAIKPPTFIEKNHLILRIEPGEPYFEPTLVPNHPDFHSDYAGMADVADRIYDLFKHNLKSAGHEDIISTIRTYSDRILPLFERGQFDLIYVDGKHDYDSVLKNITLSMPLIREGGILCGNDLEKQFFEIDLEYAKSKKGVDFVKDPHSEQSYHPGVSLAVGELLGEVAGWEGFWAMRKVGQEWQKVEIPHGQQSLLPGYLKGFSGWSEEEQRTFIEWLGVHYPQHLQQLYQHSVPQPILLVEGYRQFNIISYQGQIYALPRSEGTFNIDRINNNSYSQFFTGISVEDIQQQIDRTVGGTDFEKVSHQQSWEIFQALQFASRILQKGELRQADPIAQPLEQEIIKINNEFNFELFVAGAIPMIKRGGVTQKYVDWAKDSSFYLGTIPRSGTNLIEYFFDYFHLALLGQLDFNNPKKENVSRGGWTANMQKSLGFKWFLISHNNCPGFESLCNGMLREKWNDSFESYPLWDYIDVNYIFLMEKYRNLLYPNLNKNVRIVFLYRNPLDHQVSLLKHVENHINPLTVYPPKTHMGAYLRMYMSYYYMKQNFPNNIKFISYENLVNNVSDTLKEILAYFRFDLSLGNRMELFEMTLALVKPENLRKVELKTGTTLAKDQKLSSREESHMRGGEVGKWKRYFSTQDIISIEKEFNSFDLSLNNFDGIKINFDEFDMTGGQFDPVCAEQVSPELCDSKIEPEKYADPYPQPTLLLEGYRGFNIIGSQNRIYAILQNEGAFDINRINNNSYSRSVIGSSVEEIKQAIDRYEDNSYYPQPVILAEGYRGLNIVGYQNQVYAVPPGEGMVNLLFAGASIKEVMQQIDNASVKK